MAKFLEVKLSVPLTDSQAEVLGDVADFNPELWNGYVSEAIRRAYINELDAISILDTRIIDTDAGFVLPEILP